jgi:hypothetical protein
VSPRSPLSPAVSIVTAVANSIHCHRCRHSHQSPRSPLSPLHLGYHCHYHSPLSLSALSLLPLSLLTPPLSPVTTVPTSSLSPLLPLSPLTTVATVITCRVKCYTNFAACWRTLMLAAHRNFGISDCWSKFKGNTPAKVCVWRDHLSKTGFGFACWFQTNCNSPWALIALEVVRRASGPAHALKVLHAFVQHSLCVMPGKVLCFCHDSISM